MCFVKTCHIIKLCERYKKSMSTLFGKKFDSYVGQVYGKSKASFR